MMKSLFDSRYGYGIVTYCALVLLVQPQLIAEERFPIWSAYTDMPAATEECDPRGSPSAPLLIDSLVVLRSQDGTILTADHTTGKRIWRSIKSERAVETPRETEQATLEQPVIAFAHLAFAGHSLIVNYDHADEEVSALDVKQSGQLLWRVPCQGKALGRTLCPAMKGDSAIGLMSVFPNHIECCMLDGRTGETVSSFKLSTEKGANISGAGNWGRIAFSRTPGLCFLIRGQAVLAINIDTQSLQWQVKLAPPLDDSVSAHSLSGRIILVDGTRCVALDERTGAKAWSFDDLDSIRVVQDLVESRCILFRDGKMSAHSCSQGEVLWSVDFNSTLISGDPSMYGREIVIPQGKRTLVIHSDTTGERTDEFHIGPRVGSVFQVGDSLVTFDGCVLNMLVSQDAPTLTNEVRSKTVGNRQISLPQLFLRKKWRTIRESGLPTDHSERSNKGDGGH